MKSKLDTANDIIKSASLIPYELSVKVPTYFVLKLKQPVL